MGIVVEFHQLPPPPVMARTLPSALQREPTDTAFSKNLSLAISLNQNGVPADVNVVEDSQPYQAQDYSLNHTATPMQKLAFEAYALNLQMTGLMALSRDMSSGTNDMKLASPDWQNQIGNISALLEKVQFSTSQLYEQINATALSELKVQNKKIDNQHIRARL